MTDETNAGKQEERGKVDPTPTGKAQPVDPSSPPIIVAGTQEQITSKSGSEKPKDKRDKSKEILVRVLEDDALSTFETKTLFWGRIGIILAITTFLVGALTLIVFYRQLGLMQTQLQEAESDGRTASRHARQQLREMQAQVDAMQRQIQLEQRPWIVFTEVVAETEIKAGGDFYLYPKAKIRNIGRTPAMNTFACTNRTIDPRVVQGRCNKDSEKIVPAPVLTPGDLPYPLTVGQYKLSKEQIDDIQKGNGNFYVFSHITYCDVLSRQMITNFCAQLNRDVKTFGPCPFGNEYIDAGACPSHEQRNKQAQ